MKRQKKQKEISPELQELLALMREFSTRKMSSLGKAELVTKAIKDLGATAPQVALALNCSAVHVRDLLALGGAAEVIRKAVGDGKLSVTAAIELQRRHGDQAEAVFVQACGKGTGALTMKALGDPSERAIERAIARNAKAIMALFEGLLTSAAHSLSEDHMAEIKRISGDCNTAVQRAQRSSLQRDSASSEAAPSATDAATGGNTAAAA